MSRSRSASQSRSISRCSSPINPEMIIQAKEACVKRILEAQEQLERKRRKLEESGAEDKGQ